MALFNVTTDDQTHERMKQAAKQAGLSVREWCRRAIEAYLCDPNEDTAKLIRDIHRTICPERSEGLSQPVRDAADALSQLGMSARDAVARARATNAAKAGLDTPEIIKEALRKE